MKEWKGDKMSDAIAKMGNSIIQHGKMNNRIYLMKLDIADVTRIIPALNRLAIAKDYAKIFVKIPAEFKRNFLFDKFVVEAKIPNFFNGKSDAIFMGKFFVPQKNSSNKFDIPMPKEHSSKKINSCFKFQVCSVEDAPEIANLYAKVFKTYPFPIDDVNYIRSTMAQNVEYFSIRCDGKIVALSSSEFDFAAQNAEMTDFATLEEFRGKNLASYLLSKMETNAKRKKIKTLYTIAKASSAGMNTAFVKNGYTYCGTLVDNTNIDGAIEDMNVLYKSIKN